MFVLLWSNKRERQIELILSERGGEQQCLGLDCKMKVKKERSRRKKWRTDKGRERRDWESKAVESHSCGPLARPVPLRR